MTSTYDHRIIQGAESGRFLARIEEYLQDERSFYEDVFASLGIELSTLAATAAAEPRRATLRPRRDGASRGGCRRPAVAGAALGP